MIPPLHLTFNLISVAQGLANQNPFHQFYGQDTITTILVKAQFVFHGLRIGLQYDTFQLKSLGALLFTNASRRVT
jgi:hypothetical protein